MNPQATPSPEQAPQAPLPEVTAGVVMPEQAPAPAAAETTPVPAAAPQNSGQPATPAPALTRDDVAAAIASMPAPAAPVIQMPGVAADQDVVEPEWVEAAEQVISQTAGNPHAEEEGFEVLQVNYLKKRYDHDVKKAEDTGA